jgi:hypothetical protein
MGLGFYICLDGLLSSCMHIHAYTGSPIGKGDGDAQNVPSSASPDGITFGPLRSMWGLKFSQLHPLIDEFPVGDRGPLPSLEKVLAGMWIGVL